MESSRSVIGSIFAFLGTGFLVLLGIVGMTLWLNELAQLHFEQAIEARDMRAATVDLRQALLTAESSQRGFMVSNNEIYLAPYDTAKSQAQRQLAAMQQLQGRYPEASGAIERLLTIVGAKFEEMDQMVTLMRTGHADDAMALLASNRGKALMDEANVFFTGLIRQADERLTIGVSEQRETAGWLRIVSGIGAVVIVLVVGGAGYVLTRYTRALRAAHAEVGVLNAGLEQRVAERTQDLVQARDRAQVLLSEVNHRVANSLSLVSSLVSLQAKSLGDEAARKALAETQDRIFAISLVHRRLYGSNDVRVVTLDEYLTGLLDHLKTSLRNEGQGVALAYELDPVPLPTDASINLGVVVTEWVTNAFKYAYPHGKGEIRVKLKRLEDGTALLAVEDDGVGRAEGAPAKGTGLGSRIVSAMAASMQASIAYEPRNPGMAARLTFPVAAA